MENFIIYELQISEIAIMAKIAENLVSIFPLSVAMSLLFPCYYHMTTMYEPVLRWLFSAPVIITAVIKESSCEGCFIINYQNKQHVDPINKIYYQSH